jgi:hypothetical protein
MLKSQSAKLAWKPKASNIETRKEKDRNVSDSSAPVDVRRRGWEFE